jgi:hypothetical protein
MESMGFETISIGRAVSEFLLAQEEIDISQAIRKYLVDLLWAKAPGPVLCIDIDLLFHPLVKLDPLALFRHISHSTRLIMFWPGDFRDGILSYAQPGHQHYRFWKNLEDVEIKGVPDALQ